MTTQNHGVSKRSLLLLGGLTATVANPATRRKLMDALNSASENAQAAVQEAGATYQDTVRPLARQAGQQVQQGAQELAHMAAERGTEWAHMAAERGSELAGAAVSRGSDVASGLRESSGKQAQALLTAAAPVLSVAQQRLGQVLDDVQETAGHVRKDGGKAVAHGVRQGRRNALKLQTELSREVKVRGARLEKVSGRKLKAAREDLKRRAKQAARLAKRERGGSGLSGLLLTPLLIVGGGVVLARFPRVRHAILDFVRGFSPEAADALHSAGTSVRDIVGNVWMERIEPETATQAPAPKASQATGSAAYASVEPGSPAQDKPAAAAEPSKPEQTEPPQKGQKDAKAAETGKN